MSAVRQFRVGEFKCSPMVDGKFTYPGHTMLPAEANPPAELHIPYTPLLVDTGRQRLLIDLGAGPLSSETGRLPASLADAGLSLEDIDTVILSHGHADHIGQILPRAEYFMLRTEWDFWTDEATHAKLAAGELYGIPPLEQIVSKWVRNYLEPVRHRVRLLEGDTEVAPGILVIPAPGHTPGHAAILISSGRQQLLYVGDAISHPAQIAHPDWMTAFELDRTALVQTRRQLLDRAAADRCLVYPYHFPLPCLGEVSSRNGSYAWHAPEAVASAG